MDKKKQNILIGIISVIGVAIIVLIPNFSQKGLTIKSKDAEITTSSSFLCSM